MKLEKIGKLSIGWTLSRIEAKPGEDFQEFELFTMQELSKETGNHDVNIQSQFIKVAEKRLKDLTLSKQGMVVIGLTSYKAFVITKAYENRVIPSNFAYLQCDEGIDPDYVAWYFNEHPTNSKTVNINHARLNYSCFIRSDVKGVNDRDSPVICSTEIRIDLPIEESTTKTNE